MPRTTIVMLSCLVAPAASFMIDLPSSSLRNKQPTPPPIRSVRPSAGPMAEAPQKTMLEDAWDRYVLIRPGDKELKGPGWWTTRTPGTARTFMFSSLVFTACAIPVLLTNPYVLAWLIELAALDRAGVTPMEMYEKTGWFW